MAYLDNPLSTYGDNILLSPSRELDPYLHSRTRQDSFFSRPYPHRGPPGSTPRLPPTSPGGYSVPEVHRLDQGYADFDSGFGEGQQLQPALSRGPVGLHNVASPRPAFPGGSRFQEMNQTIPTQITGPTNVSFPNDTSMRTDAISFRPMQSSTPAPTPGHSRYGVPDESDSFQRSGSLQDIEQSYEPHDREAYEHEQDEQEQNFHDSPEPMTLSLESVHDSVPQTGEPQSEHEPGPYPKKTKSRSKWFVGGFVPNWMSKTRSNSKAQPPLAADTAPPHTPQAIQQSLQQHTHSPALQRAQPQPQRSRSQPLLRPQQTPYSDGPPQLPELGHSSHLYSAVPAHVPREDQPYDTHPRTESPELYNDSGSVPSYAPTYAEDFSRSTQTSNSSRPGPQTPLEPLRQDTMLPNPWENRPILPSGSLRASPVQAMLQPAADYSAMPQIIRDEHPEMSFGSHVNRVGKFISDFTHLPWVAPPTHVAAVYSPGESRRARYSDKKPGQSWYTKETHEKLDLLASGSPRPAPAPAGPQMDTRPRPSQAHRDRDRERDVRDPRRQHTAATHHRSRSRDAATAIRPMMTPGSITSRGMEPASPGASSHGQGHHSYSYCYQCAAPQIMYMYPTTSPMRAGTGGGDLPAEGQPVPMYVVPAPAPFMLPASPGGHHHEHRHHTRQPTAMSFPMPVVPVQVSPVSRSRSPPIYTGSPQRGPAQVQPLSPKRSPRGDRRSQPKASQSQPQPLTPASSPAKARAPL